MTLKTFGLAALAAALLVPAAASADPPRRGIPKGHLPPPGECRVWLRGLPPGHQPPPTDCRTARWEARHYGGRVIYGSRAHSAAPRYYDGDEGYYYRPVRRAYRCDEKDWRKGEC